MSRSNPLLSPQNIAELGLDELRKRVSGLQRESRARSVSAEQALRESEEKYRDLVENINDVIFTVDTSGTITYINPTIESLAGFTPEEVIGKPFSDYIFPDDLLKLQKSFERTLSGSIEPLEFRLLCKGGGTCRVRSSSRPKSRNGKVVALRGTISDISRQRHLETELRQSRKMEAIGRLAGGVAHDFNNLLTTIMGYCDLLNEVPDQAQKGESLLEIRRAAEMAASLTQQLLAFSRKQVLNPRILDLNAEVTRVEGMLRRLIGEGIDFRTRLSPDLPAVLCDPSQLDQVLVNLVVNARDAVQHRGTITIETSEFDCLKPEPLLHSTLSPGLYARLSVCDTGVGMDRTSLSRIFEPFYTTKKVGKGTGLGLSTVYGIICQSRGHVDVLSEPGVGTTFHVLLPRGNAQPAPTSRRPGISTERPVGSETVMVVEDDAGVRALIVQILRESGYVVVEIQHPGEALLIAERQPESIDLLIADVIMPHMNGPELAKRLSRRQKDMKILFVSGYASESFAEHGVRFGIERFLQKPFSPDRLASRVRLLLDSGSSDPRTGDSAGAD